MYNHIEKNEIESINRYKERLSNFNTEFDLGLFLYIFKKNILWVLLTFGIAALGSFIYIRYSAPIYKSETIIQIEKSNKANTVLDVEDYYETNDISAELEILKSALIVKNSIQQLPLEVSYFTQGQFLTNEIYKSSPFEVTIFEKDSAISSVRINISFNNKKSGKLYWGKNDEQELDVVFGQLIELPFATLKININDFETINRETNDVKPLNYFFVINNINSFTKSVLSNLEIEIQNPSAKTVKIGYSDNNRIKAKDIVSSLVREFKKYNVERKKQSAKQILDFLSNQISSVYEQQKFSERKIQDFKRKNNISDVKEVSAIFIDRLSQLDEAEVELEIQITLLEEIMKQINIQGENMDVYELIPLLDFFRNFDIHIFFYLHYAYFLFHYHHTKQN